MATLLNPREAQQRLSSELVVIHWRYKTPLPDNVNSGHGRPTDRVTAEECVKHCNLQYPNIEHWTEPAAA